MQDSNLKQLKLEVHDTFKKDEIKTTNFKAVNYDDVLNKSYLDKRLSKVEGQISYIEKRYKDFIPHNKEDLLIERAVGTTIQILYDKGSFDNYNNGNAHEVIKNYLITERRRPDLEESR